MILTTVTLASGVAGASPAPNVTATSAVLEHGSSWLGGILILLCLIGLLGYDMLVTRSRRQQRGLVAGTAVAGLTGIAIILWRFSAPS